jgi:kynureninase
VDAEGGTGDRGAFVIIRDPHAVELALVLQERGVHGDARSSYLRVCPDVLTTDAELVAAADIHAAVRADRNI